MMPEINGIQALKMIREKYTVKDILIDYIGIVIGSHTGIGTLAVFFLGDTKEP